MIAIDKSRMLWVEHSRLLDDVVRMDGMQAPRDGDIALAVNTLMWFMALQEPDCSASMDTEDFFGDVYWKCEAPWLCTSFAVQWARLGLIDAERQIVRNLEQALRQASTGSCIVAMFRHRTSVRVRTVPRAIQLLGRRRSPLGVLTALDGVDQRRKVETTFWPDQT